MEEQRQIIDSMMATSDNVWILGRAFSVLTMVRNWAKHMFSHIHVFLFYSKLGKNATFMAKMRDCE